MPVLDKQKLLAFSKKKAATPLAAGLLAQKRAQVGAPAQDPTPAKPAKNPEPAGGDEQEAYLFELVEEAAAAAESGVDPELEDIIAGTTSKGIDDPPPWAKDAEKWHEVAEAVGYGTGAETKYDEPYVVAAYLYKMAGGEIEGGGLPDVDESAVESTQADVTRPGGAAKALRARAAVRGAATDPGVQD